MPKLSMRAPFSQPRSPGPAAAPPPGCGGPSVRPRLPLGGGGGGAPPMARPGQRPPQRRMAVAAAAATSRPAGEAAPPPPLAPLPAPSRPPRRVTGRAALAHWPSRGAARSAPAPPRPASRAAGSASGEERGGGWRVERVSPHRGGGGSGRVSAGEGREVSGPAAPPPPGENRHGPQTERSSRQCRPKGVSPPPAPVREGGAATAAPAPVPLTSPEPARGLAAAAQPGSEPLGQNGCRARFCPPNGSSSPPPRVWVWQV